MITNILFLMTLYTPAITLEIQDTQFLVDGKPTFLLGASYYGGLGASDEFRDKDINELKKLGFNWIRVWVTWGAFENNVAAMDAIGKAREPYITKLKELCKLADNLGMVIDITFSRGNGVAGPGKLSSQEIHLNAVTTITQELKPFRNVYIDLGNERNIKDPRHVTFEELRDLRNRIKELDPKRLVTASHAGDIPEEDLKSYLNLVQVDFISPHRPRDGNSPNHTAGKTQEYLKLMEKMGKVIPVHYQEPFRKDFGKWQPTAQDFLTDLKNAIQGGAAGWCFHNGDARQKPDGRPRRSFDLRESEGRLFDQLDADEKIVVEKASSIK